MTNPSAIKLGYAAAPKASLGFTRGEEVPSPSRSPILDTGDGGLVTIAGTGTGKGVSQVIPTALTYPGSMVIMDIKGEICAVTARARREMGQEVVILDPFGKDGSNSINPMDLIDPTSIDAPDQCRRLAAMLVNNPFKDDPFWTDTARTIISGTLLFFATHIPRKDRSLGLLHRMWGVADHLNEMLACMATCEFHGGAMAAAAHTYTDAPDRTAGSIITTLRESVAFLGSERARSSVSGQEGVLKRIRDGVPITIYLRVPPHMLESHRTLLRVWMGSILTAVATRETRPEVPDLFLVDEAATLGYLSELLTASSLLRGYGLRTWTFWQSIGQMEAIYGLRSHEILDNAGSLSMFGAGNAASAQRIKDLTGYDGEVLNVCADEMIFCGQGKFGKVVKRVNYLTDPEYHGLFDQNPFYKPKCATTRNARAPQVAA